MIIDIKTELIPTLEEIATLDEVTPKLWVERKMNALLKSFWNEKLAGQIRVQKVEDIPEFETVVLNKAEEIKSREIESEVIIK